MDRFDKRDTRIFTAAAAVRSPLIIGFRLQCDAEALDSTRITVFVEFYAGNADARIVTPRDELRKQLEITIWATNGRRIQDAIDLLGITWLQFHHQSQSPQLKSIHHIRPHAHAC